MMTMIFITTSQKKVETYLWNTNAGGTLPTACWTKRGWAWGAEGRGESLPLHSLNVFLSCLESLFVNKTYLGTNFETGFERQVLDEILQILAFKAKFQDKFAPACLYIVYNTFFASYCDLNRCNEYVHNSMLDRGQFFCKCQGLTAMSRMFFYTGDEDQGGLDSAGAKTSGGNGGGMNWHECVKTSQKIS